MTNFKKNTGKIIADGKGSVVSQNLKVISIAADEAVQR